MSFGVRRSPEARADYSFKPKPLRGRPNSDVMSLNTFHLSADQIKPVAIGYGSCVATDRITVQGAAGGYCYRDDPDTSEDSGWRFFAGDESDEYANDPSNLAIYDVKTIANCDPSITALLEAPAGSALERDSSGEFVPVGGVET